MWPAFTLKKPIVITALKYSLSTSLSPVFSADRFDSSLRLPRLIKRGLSNGPWPVNPTGSL